MRSFIEDYLLDPTHAIANARESVPTESWSDNIDEDMIYAQIASGEFRLYEAMIFDYKFVGITDSGTELC